MAEIPPLSEIPLQEQQPAQVGALRGVTTDRRRRRCAPRPRPRGTATGSLSRRRALASALPPLLGFLACAPAQALARPRATLSIVGTSDLHGHLAALPWFSGYLRNLRAARREGAVIVLDAGDMFQGTLESNLFEGAPVVDAYNAMGYSAAAIGNHEFDFGPVGPAPSPAEPGDDPQGALKARARQAHFPFLAANVVVHGSHRALPWRNVHPSTMISSDGIKVGIVGVVTRSAATSTLPANVAGLDFLPLAPSIARESRRLRAHGAKVVVAVAHEGGACASFTNPDALDSCDANSEIFAVALRLPKGSVDVIVAGHTHQGIAHRVAGIPVIESYANGRAFGRVDLTVERATGKVVASALTAPHEICPSNRLDDCQPGKYLDRPVEMDQQLAALLAPALAAAHRKGEERLGIEVARPIPQKRSEESALGDLLTDLMRAEIPGSDLAILNGGYMRTGLAAGELTYGELYEAIPFDNAFATARIPAGELRVRLARSLENSGSLVSLSGLKVRARCQGKAVEVTLSRADGSPIPDDAVLKLVTTDFLATGGDGFFAGADLKVEIGLPVRDRLAAALRGRGGKLVPDELYDPARPRLQLPAQVPIRCDRDR
ncbi:MAG: 5'-nucleotidase C-terminal domain-containing protein [Polyangia bacterium]